MLESCGDGTGKIGEGRRSAREACSSVDDVGRVDGEAKWGEGDGQWEEIDLTEKKSLQSIVQRFRIYRTSSGFAAESAAS